MTSASSNHPIVVTLVAGLMLATALQPMVGVSEQGDTGDPPKLPVEAETEPVANLAPQDPSAWSDTQAPAESQQDGSGEANQTVRKGVGQPSVPTYGSTTAGRPSLPDDPSQPSLHQTTAQDGPTSASCDELGSPTGSDCTTFESTYNGDDLADIGLHADSLQNGSTVYTAESTNEDAQKRHDTDAESPWDVIVRAVDDTTGQVQWTYRYDTELHEFDTPADLVVGPDGEQVYALIQSWGGYPEEGGTAYDSVLLALDAGTGEVAWKDRYNGPDDSHDYPTGLALGAGGDRVAVGVSSPKDNYDYVARVHDAANGSLSLQVRYDNGATDVPHDVALSDDGSRLAVTGDSEGRASSGTESMQGTVMWNTTTGEQLWADRYDPRGSISTAGLQVEFRPGGDRLVTLGFEGPYAPKDPEAVTSEYVTETGRSLWRDVVDFHPFALELGPDGDSAYAIGYEGDYVTAAYTLGEGEHRWTSTYDYQDGDDFPFGLSVSPDGSKVYVTGFSKVQASESSAVPTADAATVVYEADDGDTDRIFRWDGPQNNNDAGYDLALTGGGAAGVVVGETCQPDRPECEPNSREDADVLRLGYAFTEPPSASLSAGAPDGPAPADVGFDLEASDPDGDLDSWRFDAEGDGTWEIAREKAPPESFEWRYDHGGDYDPVVQVSDDDGAVATDSDAVGVEFPDPEARFTWTPGAPTTQDLVQFREDSHGVNLSYEWSFGDGTESTAESPTHEYADDGAYEVTLTVTNGESLDGTPKQDSTTKTVRVANVRPTADFDFTPPRPDPGETVTFDATVDDPDGDVTSIDWAFDDGASASGATVEHSFEDNGTYEVTLAVEDDDGARRVVSQQVHVGDVEDDDGPVESVCEDQLETCIEWVDRNEEPDPDAFNVQDFEEFWVFREIVASDVSPDGEVQVVAGTLNSTDNDTDMGIWARETATGSLLWTERWDGPGGWHDDATDVEVGPQGTTAYVTGKTWTSTDQRTENKKHYDYATLAFDVGSGQQVWTSLFDGGRADVPLELRVHPEGTHVYVTGMAQDPESGEGDYGTVAYDTATGDEAWRSRMDQAEGQDIARGIAISPSGDALYVTGKSNDASGSAVAMTVGYDTETGEELWRSVFDNEEFGATELARDVAVHPNGSQVAVALQEFDDRVVAYDADTGKQEFNHVWYQGETGPMRLAYAPDGEQVFVTGGQYDTLEGPANGGQYRTEAIDTETGESHWVANYDGPGSGKDRPFGLAVAPGGDRIYVTGRSPGGSDRFVSGPGENDQRADEGTHDDYATVAYDTHTGKEVFAARYNGLANERDEAREIAVDPEGGFALVTGISNRTQGQADFATVRYFLTDVPDVSVDPTPTEGPEPLTVHLNPSAEDPDGELDGWRLDADGDGEVDREGEGAPPSSLSYTYTEVDQHEGELTVTDDEGGTASTTFTVDVLHAPPEAAFSFEPGYPDVDETVTFTSESTGDTASLTWTFPDGSTATGPTATHSFPEGTHAVRLTVVDVLGREDSTVRRLAVGNEAPSPDLSWTPDRVVEGETVTFLERSHDLDGTIQSYEWSLEDGTKLDGAEVDHTFPEPGSYTVELAVTDDRGQTTRATKTVTVHEAPDRFESGCSGTCPSWNTTLIPDGEGQARDTAFAPEEDRVYVTGTRPGPGGFPDVTTVALNPDSGTVAWNATFDGPASFADAPYAVLPSADGERVYVTGTTAMPTAAEGLDVLVLAYDADTGDQLWNTTFGGDSYDTDDVEIDVGFALAEAGEGDSLVVTGMLGGGDTRTLASSERADQITLSLNATTGAVEWSDRFDGPGENEDRPDYWGGDIGYDVTVDDGRVYVTGVTESSGRRDEAIVSAFQADGTPLWRNSYTGIQAALGRAVEVADGGEKLLVGATELTTATKGWGAMTALEFDADTGEVDLITRYDLLDSFEGTQDMVYAPSQDVMVLVGSSEDEGFRDPTLVAVDPDDGTHVWTHRSVSEEGNGVFVDAQLSRDGRRVAAVGHTWPDDTRDLEVAVLETATGTPHVEDVWDTDETDNPDDTAEAIAYAPSGDRVVSAATDPVPKPIAVTHHVTQPPRVSLTPEPRRQADGEPIAFQTSARDPDGDPVRWRFDTDGDGETDQAGRGLPPATLTHDYADAGEYGSRLTVVDGESGRSSVPAQVAVAANDPPTVQVPASVEVTAGDTVDVEASATDPDGDPVEWTIRPVEPLVNADGSVAEDGTATWTWTTPPFRFSDTSVTFEAEDAYHETAKTVEIDVLAPPRASLDAPVTDSGLDGSAVLSGETVTLRGSVLDPDGSIDQAMIYPEGPEGSSVNVTPGTDGDVSLEWTYDSLGDKTVILEARDGDNLTAQATQTLSVARNKAPLAEAGSDRTVQAPDVVALDASDSRDPDGHQLAYTWTLPDGTERSGARIDWAPDAPGTYTFSVTVEDALGAKDTDAVTVTVDDRLTVEAVLVDDGTVGLRERPELLVEAGRALGGPVQGAKVNVHVDAPGDPAVEDTELETSTDDDGRVLLRLPLDIQEAGQGSNLPGSHVVDVNATAPTAPGAPVPGPENATTSLTYEVQTGS